MEATQERASCNTPKTRRKLARRVARLIVRGGMTYEQWRGFNKYVRRYARLSPTNTGKRLPNILTDDELRRFFQAVDRAGNAQHGVMLRTLLYTGCRVSELCGLRAGDVDLDTGRVRVNYGKGNKDRYTLIPSPFRVAMRAYLAGRTAGSLFVGRQGPYTSRRVRQIVDGYAKAAGVKATPHTFRHQMITHLTRCGMTNGQLMPITGHEWQSALAIYQHVALDRKLEDAYDQAMREMVV